MSNKFVIIVMAIVLAFSVAFSCFLIASLKEATQGTNDNSENANSGNITDTTTAEGNIPQDSGDDNSSGSVPNGNANIRPAVDFTFYDIQGNEVKLSDYYGKPIVLNFWATWCGQCAEEMPEFDEVYKQYEGKVTFLMVNVTTSGGETIEKATAAIFNYQKDEFTLPFFLDAAGDAKEKYSLSALPFTYFINAEGNVVTSINAKISKTRLLSEIERIYTP